MNRIGSKPWGSGNLKDGDLIKVGSMEVQVIILRLVCLMEDRIRDVEGRIFIR